MKKFGALAVILSLLVLSFPGFAAAAGNSDQPVSVYVIHGIPGIDLGLGKAMPVDVLIDNEICAFQGVTFDQVAGPLALEPGKYNFKVSLASEEPCSNDPVLEGDFEFVDGENATVIAHLTADGQPTLSKFVNFVAGIGLTSGAKEPAPALLNVRHTAATSAVNVLAERYRDPGSKFVFDGLTSLDQEQSWVWSGRWDLTFLSSEAGRDPGPVAREKEPFLGPVPVRLAPDTYNFVYLVGSRANGTQAIIVHSLSF